MVRQKSNHDLPRPAVPGDRPDELVAIGKLSNVRIEDGWVRADRPKPQQAERWWEPLDEYYRLNRKSYLALAKCGDSEAAISRFLESYGTTVKDEQQTTPSEVVFRLADFRREKWCFAFAAILAGGLKKAESLRKIFLARLEQATRVAEASEDQGDWQHVIADIEWALGVSFKVPDPTGGGSGRPTLANPPEQEPTEQTGSPENYTSARLAVSKQRLGKTNEDQLARAARSYLTLVIGRRVRGRPGLNLNFGFSDDGKATFHIYSEDLLDLFYWMLAQDIERERAPIRCASCGRFFFSDKKNAIYCPNRPKCRERGRRLLDWERNKAKYNENRRLKRLRKREQRCKKEVRQ